MSELRIICMVRQTLEALTLLNSKNTNSRRIYLRALVFTSFHYHRHGDGQGFIMGPELGVSTDFRVDLPV